MRWAISLMIVAASCAAQTVPFPSKAEWTATPGVIWQSQKKYPSNVNVVLYLNACRDNSGKLQKQLSSADNYSITPTGTGVSASVQLVGDCTLTTVLAIDSSAQPGNQFLIVSKQPDKNKPPSYEGAAVLALMDSTAGPTPSAPEVDVLWDVISQHICSDSFGNHVPKYLYCIEVKVGNNSSHALQLAGVGFKVSHPFAGKYGIPDDAKLISPNIAYQTTRSVLQAGGGTTSRNLMYKSLQSLGLIMASFTPYFHNNSSKAKWSTGAAIVSGAFVQAFDLVAPDLTVRELNNLDDQAFRDGKLIPNNTQVRMIVFVDKALISGSIKEKCRALLTSKDKDGRYHAPTDLQVNDCAKSNDPTVVRVLLGDLVLVGDQVDYLQRVVVDSNVSSQEVNPAAAVKAAVVSNAPTIKDINPPSGAAGTPVTIIGTNFGATKGAVTVGGTPVTPTDWSDTSIKLIVPTEVKSGDVEVVVKVGDVSVKAPKPFTVK